MCVCKVINAGRGQRRKEEMAGRVGELHDLSCRGFGVYRCINVGVVQSGHLRDPDGNPFLLSSLPRASERTKQVHVLLVVRKSGVRCSDVWQ